MIAPLHAIPRNSLAPLRTSASPRYRTSNSNRSCSRSSAPTGPRPCRTRRRGLRAGSTSAGREERSRVPTPSCSNRCPSGRCTPRRSGRCIRGLSAANSSFRCRGLRHRLRRPSPPRRPFRTTRRAPSRRRCCPGPSRPRRLCPRSLSLNRSRNRSSTQIRSLSPSRYSKGRSPSQLPSRGSRRCCSSTRQPPTRWTRLIGGPRTPGRRGRPLQVPSSVLASREIRDAGEEGQRVLADAHRELLLAGRLCRRRRGDASG